MLFVSLLLAGLYTTICNTLMAKQTIPLHNIPSQNYGNFKLRGFECYIDLDPENELITIYMIGRSYMWMGISLGNTEMAGSNAYIYSMRKGKNEFELWEYQLGNHYIRNSKNRIFNFKSITKDGYTTVIFRRTFYGTNPDDYKFNINDDNLKYMIAAGNKPYLSYHDVGFRSNWIYLKPETNSPTYSPSFQPTLYPSITPTRTPTFQPTKEPSYNPSYQPSYEPTLTPTSIPTPTPTQYPTVSGMLILDNELSDSWSNENWDDWQQWGKKSEEMIKGVKVNNNGIYIILNDGIEYKYEILRSKINPVNNIVTMELTPIINGYQYNRPAFQEYYHDMRPQPQPYQSVKDSSSSSSSYQTSNNQPNTINNNDASNNGNNNGYYQDPRNNDFFQFNGFNSLQSYFNNNNGHGHNNGGNKEQYHYKY